MWSSNCEGLMWVPSVNRKVWKAVPTAAGKSVLRMAHQSWEWLISPETGSSVLRMAQRQKVTAKKQPPQSPSQPKGLFCLQGASQILAVQSAISCNADVVALLGYAVHECSLRYALHCHWHHLNKKSETRMTASVLKQDPNTWKDPNKI